MKSASASASVTRFSLVGALRGALAMAVLTVSSSSPLDLDPDQALAAFRLEVARQLGAQGLSRKEDLSVRTDGTGAKHYMLPDPLTRVVHVRRDAYSVYIGRPMPGFRAVGWGNPFRGPGAIAKYRRWIETQPMLLARLPELKGKVLGCWCAAKGGIGGNLDGHICHGEVLAALADALGACSESGSGGDAA